MEHRNFAT